MAVSEVGWEVMTVVKSERRRPGWDIARARRIARR